tara:strand:- start:1150 stop:1782 length:633 start_codon:yes stop_codon:yes gene_type:complete
MAFNTVYITAEPNSENNLEELFDEFFLEAKLKSGSVLLERLRHGRKDGRTHRLVWIWELNNGGRVEGDMKDFENDAFWGQFNNYVESWGDAAAGRFLSWKEGDVKEFPFGHLWDITPKDPIAFKKAHDKIVKDASKVFENKVVGFGTYDINRPNGASHWVVIGGKGVNGHLSMHQDLEDNYSKAMNEYFEKRGEVEHVHDFMVEVLKRYQ